MAKLISLLFDVEDPFAPDTDDAALTVANVVTDVGLRGTFCVTGEKCRKLLERGRTDVIDALKRHALGLHTNTHSFHPTTMELLEEKGWEDGVAAAVETEGRGLESFRQAFDREPCCWGGGGNTWGPQINGALKVLGIPALVYSQIALPDKHVHEYVGVPSFGGCAYLDEENMDSPPTADAAAAAAVARVQASPAAWFEVFCGHPTKYRYERFWDVPFFNGATPEAYDRGPRVPDDAFAERMRNLGRSLERLCAELDILGLDDVLKLRWRFRDATDEEIAAARTGTAANVRAAAGWPPNRQDLDTTNLERETVAHMDTLRIAESYG